MAGPVTFLDASGKLQRVDYDVASITASFKVLQDGINRMGQTMQRVVNRANLFAQAMLVGWTTEQYLAYCDYLEHGGEPEVIFIMEEALEVAT